MPADIDKSDLFVPYLKMDHRTVLHRDRDTVILPLPPMESVQSQGGVVRVRGEDVEDLAVAFDQVGVFFEKLLLFFEITLPE